MLGRLGCLFGKHERSKHHVKRVGDNYTTVCVHCRRPMIRPQDQQGAWVLRAD